MSSRASRALGLDVSAYLLRGTLIDTGCPAAAEDVLPAARSLGAAGAIVTHWHEDHAGNVRALATQGLPLWLHPATEARLRRLEPLKLYRRVSWGRSRSLDVAVKPYNASGFDCIHTPGHSSDHHVVWDRETGTLFSGDLWLGVRSRVMHASEDPHAILESLERVRALGPARMFDAHRGLVTEPAGALAARIDWLRDVLGAIERRIAEGASDRAIVTEVLGGEELVALLSRGEYARRNLVAAVRRRAAER